MLEFGPCYEACGRALSHNATDARSCSCECAFCSGSVERMLRNVRRNCGGDVTPQPARQRYRLERVPAGQR